VIVCEFVLWVDFDLVCVYSFDGYVDDVFVACVVYE